MLCQQCQQDQATKALADNQYFVQCFACGWSGTITEYNNIKKANQLKTNKKDNDNNNQ